MIENDRQKSQRLLAVGCSEDKVSWLDCNGLPHFIHLLCLCSGHIEKARPLLTTSWIIRVFSFFFYQNIDFSYSVRTCLQGDDVILDLHFSILGKIMSFFLA